MLALLVLPGAGHSLKAQLKKVPADSSQVRLRSISPASLQKYRDDSEFNYEKQSARDAGLWERFWRWVDHTINKVGSNSFWSVFFKILLWGLCIFAFVYTVLKLTGMTGISVFTGNKKADGLDYVVTEDNIYAINFTESIAKAKEQKNYRLAIRLLYLQTLRKLADRELIQWKLNKTNDIYAQELAGGNHYADFTRLTRTYDYAWYGNFPVEEDQFAGVQQYFTNFQQQLPG